MANVPHQAKSTSQTTSGAYGLQVVRIMSSNQCTCSKCACMLTMTSMTPGCDVSPVASISGIDFSYLVASVLSINIRMPKDMAMEETNAVRALWENKEGGEEEDRAKDTTKEVVNKDRTKVTTKEVVVEGGQGCRDG
eukprot:scaffold59665_cov19-Tisochrysis_lutea.AAC.2